MKKIVLGLIATVLLFSCSNENSEIETSKTEVSKLIEKKTGLVEIKEGKDFNLLKSKSKLNSKTTYYKSKDDNSFIVLNNIDNKYYLEKGIITNGEFITKSRFELSDNMDDKGNGNLIIKNVNENITILQTYENGIFTNNIISEPNNNLYARGLCQREKGESFKDCNIRETEEFCDDFVSTVAYITNPSIAVLIAALCSC
jgi:hypothetical protein